LDVVLSSALRDRSDIVVARVTVPLLSEAPAPQDAAVEPPPPSPTAA
jgi:hypothetical protein